MVTNTIADLMARLQNGITAKKDTITVPSTKMVGEVLRVLKQEKMIANYELEDGVYTVSLMYRENGESEILKVSAVSKPGQRIYVNAKEIKPVMNGRGISIISTSNGIMSGAQAKAKGIGGELICEIW